MSAANAESADALVGTVLQNRYRVLRRIGAGGMGAVYEAEHTRIRKRVALKVLHPLYAERPDAAARFEREALAATAIGHQNIVEVHDMGELPDGGHFIVLEYLDGRDLGRLIEEDGALSIRRAVHIVIQICEAMQAAHDQEIVHRDLKPANIFLTRRGEEEDFVKVLDFGISKIRDSEIIHRESNKLTKTGDIIGSALYLSPEQANGEPDLDHRSDIYSIGVILFEILTLRVPFEPDSFFALLAKLANESAPRASSLRAEIPSTIDEIIDKCLAKDREDRFQSCVELRDALIPFREFRPPVVVQSGRSLIDFNRPTVPATDSIAPLIDSNSRPGACVPARSAASPIPAEAASAAPLLPTLPLAPSARVSAVYPPPRPEPTHPLPAYPPIPNPADSTPHYSSPHPAPHHSSAHLAPHHSTPHYSNPGPSAPDYPHPGPSASDHRNQPQSPSRGHPALESPPASAALTSSVNHAPPRTAHLAMLIAICVMLGSLTMLAVVLAYVASQRSADLTTPALTSGTGETPPRASAPPDNIPTRRAPPGAPLAAAPSQADYAETNTEPGYNASENAPSENIPRPTVPATSVNPEPAKRCDDAIRLVVNPPTSLVYVDDALLVSSNSVYELECDPRDHRDHALRVQSDGYESITRAIRFDEAIELTIELTRLPTSRSRGRATRPPSRRCERLLERLSLGGELSSAERRELSSCR